MSLTLAYAHDDVPAAAATQFASLQTRAQKDQLRGHGIPGKTKMREQNDLLHRANNYTANVALRRTLLACLLLLLDGEDET